MFFIGGRLLQYFGLLAIGSALIRSQGDSFSGWLGVAGGLTIALGALCEWFSIRPWTDARAKAIWRLW